jgi:hypothetical protein
MFDLARETKRKVDEAMQDREAWRTGDIPDKEGRCAGKTADTF